MTTSSTFFAPAPRSFSPRRPSSWRPQQQQQQQQQHAPEKQKQEETKATPTTTKRMNNIKATKSPRYSKAQSTKMNMTSTIEPQSVMSAPPNLFSSAGAAAGGSTISSSSSKQHRLFGRLRWNHHTRETKPPEQEAATAAAAATATARRPTKHDHHHHEETREDQEEVHDDLRKEYYAAAPPKKAQENRRQQPQKQPKQQQKQKQKQKQQRPKTKPKFTGDETQLVLRNNPSLIDSDDDEEEEEDEEDNEEDEDVLGALMDQRQCRDEISFPTIRSSGVGFYKPLSEECRFDASSYYQCPSLDSCDPLGDNDMPPVVATTGTKTRSPLILHKADSDDDDNNNNNNDDDDDDDEMSNLTISQYQPRRRRARRAASPTEQIAEYPKILLPNTPSPTPTPPHREYEQIEQHDQEDQDMQSLAETLTVLSAFSLITPPNQWIHKDSFLHRRLKFEQWGIPISKEMKKNTYSRLFHKDYDHEYDAPRGNRYYSQVSALQVEKKQLERALHERLVWILYKDKYWWPAIVYDNYRQLIQDQSLSQHVWYRLPFWKRFQLASLLVWSKEDDRRNHTQVARLLGRGNTNDVDGTGGSIEIVEVQETWPFQDESKVTQVIGEMALNGDFFRDNPTLYLDWHRAMDQMEHLLSDCLGIDLDALEERAARDPRVEEKNRQQQQQQYHQKHKHKHGAKKKATNSTPAKFFGRGEVSDMTDGDSEDELMMMMEEDNSLIASTVASSSYYYYSADRTDNTDDHTDADGGDGANKAALLASPTRTRRKTWLERAKEAEQKQWVAKCQGCSDIILDSVEGACDWKDSTVASWFDQPTEAMKRLERNANLANKTNNKTRTKRGGARGSPPSPAATAAPPPIPRRSNNRPRTTPPLASANDSTSLYHAARRKEHHIATTTRAPVYY